MKSYPKGGCLFLSLKASSFSVLVPYIYIASMPVLRTLLLKKGVGDIETNAYV